MSLFTTAPTGMGLGKFMRGMVLGSSEEFRVGLLSVCKDVLLASLVWSGGLRGTLKVRGGRPAGRLGEVAFAKAVSIEGCGGVVKAFLCIIQFFKERRAETSLAIALPGKFVHNALLLCR